jgi:hypothetical protein
LFLRRVATVSAIAPLSNILTSSASILTVARLDHAVRSSKRPVSGGTS